MNQLFQFSLIVAIACYAPTAPAADAVNVPARAGDSNAVSSAAAVPIPGGTITYRYGFEPEPGLEPDDWPEGWTRRRGSGFPLYLPVTIQGASKFEGKYALRMELNGGGVAMFSPPIACNHLADYVFQAAVKASNLRYNRAFCTLSFVDDERRVLTTHTSEEVTQTNGWMRLRVGPCRAPPDQARQVVIGLHLEPTGERHDIHGAAEFDDLVLSQVPRVLLELDDRLAIYSPQRELTLRCRTLGEGERPTGARCRVFDALGREVNVKQTEVSALKLHGLEPAPFEETVEPPRDSGPGWKMKLTEPGFYRLHVELTYGDKQVQHGETTVAVLAPMGLPPRGEFGWSMPRGCDLSSSELTRLLRESGVSWVKLPVWVGEDRPSIERLVVLSKELRTAGIDLIGVVGTPPAEIREKLHIHPSSPISQVIRLPGNEWLPSLDPLLSRLSWQVRAWQLGNDRDLSLVTVPELETKLAGLKQQLDVAGDNVSLGVAWPWKTSDPKPSTEQGTLPWRFASVSDSSLHDTAPPSAELLDGQLLDAAKQSLPRWVSLEPVTRPGRDAAPRIVDLVERMALAKQHGLQGIFLYEPLRESGGLYTTEHRPDELLLPWRTTALLLAGSRYLGELTLPGGSANRVFSRDGLVTLLCAAREPGTETLYLGDNVRQINVWGQSVKPPQDGLRQIIELGKLPIFVTNVDEAVTRFRLQLKLAHPRLPSQFGVSAPTHVQVTNTFPTVINGVLKIVPPGGWRASPDRVEFRLEAGQTAQIPFDWHVPLTGTSSPQPVRFDFDVQGQRRFQFGAHATVEVGLGDLQLLLTSQLNEQGELVVEQRIVNDTPQAIGFKCHLYVPEQRRQRVSVNTPPHSESRYTYTLPAGESLVGQMLWVRAEEIGGTRVLSERFVPRKTP